MAANNYRIILNNTTDSQVTIPIEIDWDFAGQDQSIDLYEDEVVKDVVGEGYDFEVERFPHDIDEESGKSEINYEFYFYSGGSLGDVNSWHNSYLTEGLTTKNIYFFENDFKKSFFKLDFYDTIDDKKQTNYITVIIPTQQGYKADATLNRDTVQIKIPKFSLDYIGDKEGFFIYWLKKLDFLNINTFYMTAKFYNASIGQFVKMMNEPQSSIAPASVYSFDAMKYFYYRVVFDYINKCYRVYRFDPNTNNSVRVGTAGTPITWYEYINP
jgi:hypothetical protein